MPIPLILFLLFCSCQGSDLTSDAEQKRNNQKGEYLYRTHDQVTAIPPMEKVPLPAYPWEKEAPGQLPSVTKEYFRCRGSSLNPVKSELVRGENLKYHDCGGSQKHSLPLRDGKEWVFPVYLEIFNYIQSKTGKRVVITSGHRCPDHNTYVDSSPLNQSSKHLIGAEVDFYVQGMESKPEAVINLVIEYYQSHPKYKTQKEFTEFKRYEKETTNVSTLPWMNKELFIKLYKPKEGRNFDNRHPYPYLSIQVRYDRDRNERVTYSWDQAFRNYLRY